MGKIRCAVIGVGYLGGYHAEKYAALADVDLVGIIDSDFTRAKQIALKLGSTPYSDYREVINIVDAVSIVTPTISHFEIAREFLKKGVHCLLEKPMTQTIEQADELNSIAGLNDLVFQIGLLERFNPAVAAAIPHIERPLFIESHRLHQFHQRGIDVDVVLDLMIHDLDLILSFVREMPCEIRAAGVPILSQNSDIANVRMEFPGGCVANITASRISFKNMRKFRLFQKNAYIGIDCGECVLEIVRQQAKDGLEGDLVSQKESFEKQDTLKQEIESFISCIIEGEKPVVDGVQARNSLAVAIEINKIIKEKLQQVQ